MKDDLSDIEPDAELDRLPVAPHRLFAKFRLDLNGETKRHLGIVEQRDDPVPGDIGHSAAVIADQRAEELQRSRHLAGAARFVELHPSAELDHVGKQHGSASGGRVGRTWNSRWFRRYHPPQRRLRVRWTTLPKRSRE